jgi:hypothetical protein
MTPADSAGMIGSEDFLIAKNISVDAGVKIRLL